MKFLQMSLYNFKGITDRITIDICDNQKPLTIVGNNECGKTTILKGLELIGKLCKCNEINEKLKENVSSSKPRRMRFEGTMIFEVIVVCEEKDKETINGDVIQKLSKNEDKIKIVFSFEFVVMTITTNHTIKRYTLEKSYYLKTEILLNLFVIIYLKYFITMILFLMFLIKSLSVNLNHKLLLKMKLFGRKYLMIYSSALYTKTIEHLILTAILLESILLNGLRSMK